MCSLRAATNASEAIPVAPLELDVGIARGANAARGCAVAACASRSRRSRAPTRRRATVSPSGSGSEPASSRTARRRSARCLEAKDDATQGAQCLAAMRPRKATAKSVRRARRHGTRRSHRSRLVVSSARDSMAMKASSCRNSGAFALSGSTCGKSTPRTPRRTRPARRAVVSLEGSTRAADAAREEGVEPVRLRVPLALPERAGPDRAVREGEARRAQSASGREVRPARASRTA